METSGDIDWSAFGDGPAILERPYVEAGECRAISSVAGLQFYGYHRPDGLDGRVVPLPGDRLTLVRRPDNLADPNAVEVWWRNSHQLGHLPRRVAKSVAPRIDLGESVRAYVWDGGTGASWSLRAWLVGPAAYELHREQASWRAEGLVF